MQIDFAKLLVVLSDSCITYSLHLCDSFATHSQTFWLYEEPSFKTTNVQMYLSFFSKVDFCLIKSCLILDKFVKTALHLYLVISMQW